MRKKGGTERKRTFLELYACVLGILEIQNGWRIFKEIELKQGTEFYDLLYLFLAERVQCTEGSGARLWLMAGFLPRSRYLDIPFRERKNKVSTTY